MTERLPQSIATRGTRVQEAAMNQVATGEFAALAPGAGQSVWFMGTLMTVKVGAAQTGGAYMVGEWLLPPGFGPPPHIHHDDDETLYILEGELSGFCGEQVWRGGAGTFVLLPRGLPHGFRVEGATPARVLQLGNGSGFERFIAEAGAPAQTLTLPPPPGEAEIARMLAAAPKYAIEVLPLPAG
ncbi:MAG: cupin domain-containing protein [Chloroflexota bacterium]|nr:cupin domain-containing protein [Chloroflexota bacterium]